MASLRIWLVMVAALSFTTCMRGTRPDALSVLATREDLPPISLVTPEGVELELVSVEAKALLAEPLAFTELHLRFRNPESRQLEGRFRVVLPPSASVARFAMKVRSNWEEAELVELSQAREAYEMFLHRRQDPALLEQSAGNEFSARVFPIAPKEEKELILGYSEELVQPDQPYRIAFKGIRTGAPFAVTVLEPGKPGHARRVLVPTAQDFVQPLAGGERLLRHDDLVVGRRFVPGTTVEAPIRSLAVLFDTSASRALGLQQQVALLRALLAEARKQGLDFPLRVLAFDQETVDVYDGPAQGFGEAQERLLLDRGALGGSNLEQALRVLEQRLSRKPAERILIVGDGVTTAGALDGASLLPLTAALAQHGARRLDALVVGGVRDEARVAGLTAGGLPDDGAVLTGEHPTAWLWSRLTRKAAKEVEIPTLSEATWSWPQKLRGVLPGDPVMVVTRLEKNASTLPSLMEVDDSIAPLLERAAARAHIAELEEKIDQAPADGHSDLAALTASLIKASTSARVLSRLTGFVVLENDTAWMRSRASVEPSTLLSLDGNGLHSVLHMRESAGGALAPSFDEIPLRRQSKARDRTRPRPEMDPVSREPTIVLDDALSSVRELAKESYASRPSRPSRPEPKPEAPPPPSEPAVFHDGAAGVRLPQLPPEPDDELAGTHPQLNVAGGAGQMRQPILPAPPSYRSSDFDKLPKPYTGRFGEIMDLLARGKHERARNQAEAWHQQEPGQTLALVALGEACRFTGDVRRAARAFGSIIDLFPARADMRRFAAGRLASLRDASALELAIDSAARAVDARPDHPSGHHLLAVFLLEAGRYEQALAVLTHALDLDYDRRYLQADRILREDASLAAQALIKANPARAAEMRRRLRRVDAESEEMPSLRFVLTWESDANDVDFHVRDGLGYHAFYATRVLPTGGELYADVRDGYGPECFAVRGPVAHRAYPYRLAVRYASRGPMGYGMGTLQIIEHDGLGNLRFSHRPFVIMNDGGYLELPEVPATR